VTATTNAYGGNGSVGFGGRASAVTTAATVGASHTVVANGRAIAGTGGSVDGGNGKLAGAGGEASSISVGNAIGNSLVVVNAVAKAGAGGRILSGSGAGGAGGAANVVAMGSNAGSQTVTVTALANGGAGGVGSGGANGSGGDATALATGRGGGTVLAHADANPGLGGIASAHSNASNASPGVLVPSITARADGPAGSRGITEARVANGDVAPSPSMAAGLQAAAFATGSPTNADATGALTGSYPRLQVRENFDVGGTSDILGLVVLGAQNSFSGSGGPTYSAAVDFKLDLSQLSNPQELLIGLLQPATAGTGLHLLHFQINVNGGPVEVDQTFTSAAAAMAFFTGHTLDLGGIATWTGSGGLVDLLMQVDLASDVSGEGFRFDAIFGNSTLGSGPAVPVPAAAWLFPSALAALGWLRRKRTNI
jgi:hypothetical protein